MSGYNREMRKTQDLFCPFAEAVTGPDRSDANSDTHATLDRTPPECHASGGMTVSLESRMFTDPGYRFRPRHVAKFRSSIATASASGQKNLAFTTSPKHSQTQSGFARGSVRFTRVSLPACRVVSEPPLREAGVSVIVRKEDPVPRNSNARVCLYPRWGAPLCEGEQNINPAIPSIHGQP
jgi:hypothetical protein